MNAGYETKNEQAIVLLLIVKFDVDKESVLKGFTCLQ